MITGHFGRAVALEEVLGLSPPARGGTSRAQLADAAERLGMRDLVARIAFENLRRVNLPCIAHWHGSHFVVVEEDLGTPRSRCGSDPRPRHLPRRRVREGVAVADGTHGTVLLLEQSHEFEPSARGGFADV